MRPRRTGMVRNRMDLHGATRAESCFDRDLKRYATGRDVDLVRQRFAATLRKWIHDTGRTVTGLGVETGIPRNTIVGWLRPITSPSPHNMSLLRALGFDPDEADR